MNESKEQYKLGSNNAQTRLEEKPGLEIRRPILKASKFFGLKTRRWAVLCTDELLIYKTKKSLLLSKKLCLKDINFVFLPERKLAEDNKSSKYTVKLIYQGKQIYWLQALNLQDYLFIKSKFERPSQQKAEIEQHLNIQPLHQSTVVHKEKYDMKDALSGSQLNIVEKAASDSDLEQNFNEEDLIETNELVETAQYNMSFYSGLRVWRKITLEERFNIENQKGAKVYSEALSDRHEISEGPIDFSIPYSNMDVTNLKTKRTTDRSVIELFLKQETYKSQHSGSKFESPIHLASNIMNLPISFDIVKEQFDDDIEEQFAKRKGKKREFRASNTSEQLKNSLPRVSEMKESITSAPFNKEVHSEGEEEALKDENIILRTLTYAREVREIKDEYKVFKRMQSKKNAPLNRHATFFEPRKDEAYKLELPRRHKTYCGETNIPGKNHAKLEFQRMQSNMLNFDDAVELLNKFELKQAKELFSYLSNQNPRLKIFVIECDLLVLSLTGFKELVDSCLADLVQLSHQLGQVATSYKLDANLHFENEITKAECILLKGLLNAILSNKWQAFLCLSESWRIVNKLGMILNKKNSNVVLTHEILHRVLFAIGAFNLAFSLVPSGLLKLLKIIGMTPNKELGLANLQKCWNAKFSRSVYAALLVCCYHLEFELESQKACEIVESGLVQFDRFPLFSWVGAILSWRFTQPHDVEVLVLNGIEQCKEIPENPIFLTYELGWYYLITGKWDSALQVFLKLISGILKPQFFENFEQELQQLSKILRQKGIDIETNFGPFPFKEAKYALFPHLTHILLNISACYYETGNLKESDRWLFAAIIANKKYLNYSNKTENDFGRLSEKFLKRKSRKMLAFELLCFLKQLQKLPDSNLTNLNNAVLKRLPISLSDLSKKSKATPVDDVLDFVSGMLVVTVNNCLMGESARVISESEKLIPVLELVPAEFAYLTQHFFYWFGRAGISEDNRKFAGNMLRKAAKIKTNEFVLADKSKKLIQQFNL